MVFAVASRLLGRAEDAEDVAQTVFLRAFERFGQIGNSPTAAAWLRTVTRNECLNHLTRYRRRWRLFSELGRAGQDADPEPFETQLPAAEAPGFEAAERAEHLEAALGRLPDAQRVPLVLFHFEEMRYQDIADLLGVSLAKLKTDIHRGREALRKFLTVDHGPR